MIWLVWITVTPWVLESTLLLSVSTDSSIEMGMRSQLIQRSESLLAESTSVKEMFPVWRLHSLFPILWMILHLCTTVVRLPRILNSLHQLFHLHLSSKWKHEPKCICTTSKHLMMIEGHKVGVYVSDHEDRHLDNDWSLCCCCCFTRKQLLSQPRLRVNSHLHIVPKRRLVKGRLWEWYTSVRKEIW
jgi:hypothetical protein